MRHGQKTFLLGSTVDPTVMIPLETPPTTHRPKSGALEELRAEGLRPFLAQKAAP